MQKVRFSIKTKLILIFGLIIIFVSTTQNFMAVRTARSSMIETIETRLANRAKDVAEIVDSRVKSFMQFLTGLSCIPDLSDATVSFEKKAKLITLQSIFNKDIQLVSISDTKGFLYTYGEETIDASKQDWFPIVMSGKNYISEPFTSLIDGKLVIFVAVPIYDKNSSIVGSIGVTLKGSWLSDQIKDIVIGKTGCVYIIGKSGDEIADANFKYVEDKWNTIREAKNDSKLEKLAEIEKKALSNQASGTSTYNWNGIKEMAGYASVGTYGWGLIACAPINEFLEGVNYLELLLIIIGSIIVVIAIVTVYFFAHLLVKPIKKATLLSEQAAKGIFDKNDLIIKSNDEVGQLVNSMNKWIEMLRDRRDAKNKIADGDLTVKIELASDKDEIGLALTKMVKKLGDIVSKIRDSVYQVNEGARQISDSSQVLSHGAAQQASSLEEITASLHEMSVRVGEHTEGAIKSSEITKETRQKAVKGTDQMRELVEAMKDIEKSAYDIKNIVEVIDDIAFQTNLLALNADIEAARVGKYGKGFAVVANSVRTLANKSQESVKETTEMVELALNNVRRGSELVGITSKQLEEITQASFESTKIANMAAQASQEQARGIQQINQAIASVEEVVQSNSASAEENAASSEELATQSKLLLELVSYFKTNKSQFTDKNIDDEHEESSDSSILALTEADI